MVETSINNHGAFIWAVADLLRGDYKQSEYGKVVLPLTVLRRLDCVLESTKSAVLARAAKLRGQVDNVEPVLCTVAGQRFYNTSPLDFARLLDDPAQIAGNLRAYVAGFSSGAREVLDKFDFDTQVTRPRGRGTVTSRPPSTTGPSVVPCQLASRSTILACLAPIRAVISAFIIWAITIRPTSAQKPSSPSVTAPARSANATVASSGRPARLAVSTSATLTTGTFFIAVVLLLVGVLGGTPDTMPKARSQAGDHRLTSTSSGTTSWAMLIGLNRVPGTRLSR